MSLTIFSGLFKLAFRQPDKVSAALLWSDVITGENTLRTCLRQVLMRGRDKYDRSDLYMRYIIKNPGIFIDTGVYDIDLTLSFFGSNARPKSCYGVGNIALHKERAEIQDVDNAIGTVEWYPPEEGAPAPMSYYYISRIMQHGFDNPTEIVGTKGVLKVNLSPRRDLLTIADENGIGNDVSPDFYERYERAFVKELSVFADCISTTKTFHMSWMLL